MVILDDNVSWEEKNIILNLVDFEKVTVLFGIYVKVSISLIEEKIKKNL